MNKTNLTAGIAIGACFACIPFWLLELIGKPVIYTVWGLSLTTLTLLVTGVLGKIFNKKK